MLVDLVIWMLLCLHFDFEFYEIWIGILLFLLDYFVGLLVLVCSCWFIILVRSG